MIGEFKMAAGDVISIRGQVMEYTYIPTGIRRELVRFSVDCNQKGYVVRTVRGGPVAIHSNGQFSFSPTSRESHWLQVRR